MIQKGKSLHPCCCQWLKCLLVWRPGRLPKGNLLLTRLPAATEVGVWSRHAAIRGFPAAPYQSLPPPSLLVLKTCQDPLRLGQTPWYPLLLSSLKSLGAGSPRAQLCLCTYQLLLTWLSGEHETLLMRLKPYKCSRQDLKTNQRFPSSPALSQIISG